MATIFPHNQLNYTIKKLIKDANSSLEDILKLEKYYENQEERHSEKEKFKELVSLREQLEKITELKYYKTSNK